MLYLNKVIFYSLLFLKGGYQISLEEGEAGLKVYDISDKLHIDDHQIASFPNINTYDVIPVNGYLFMIGDDGFYQYDYSDTHNIFQVSFIPVAGEDKFFRF